MTRCHGLWGQRTLGGVIWGQEEGRVKKEAWKPGHRVLNRKGVIGWAFHRAEWENCVEGHNLLVRHAGKFAIPGKRVAAVALWGNLRGEEIVTEKGLVGN